MSLAMRVVLAYNQDVTGYVNMRCSSVSDSSASDQDVTGYVDCVGLSVSIIEMSLAMWVCVAHQ